jgi:Flp pilus assembly protein TadG
MISTRAPRQTPRRGTRAQAIVEFALALPILCLLIFGVLDAGRAVVAAIALSNAAAMSARYAAVNCGGSKSACTDNLQAPVRDVFVNICSADTAHPVLASVCTTIDSAALGTDTSQIKLKSLTVDLTDGSVSLVVEYPFQAAVPLVASALGLLTLTASASTHIA